MNDVISPQPKLKIKKAKTQSKVITRARQVEEEKKEEDKQPEPYDPGANYSKIRRVQRGDSESLPDQRLQLDRFNSDNQSRINHFDRTNAQDREQLSRINALSRDAREEAKTRNDADEAVPSGLIAEMRETIRERRQNALRAMEGGGNGQATGLAQASRAQDDAEARLYNLLDSNAAARNEIDRDELARNVARRRREANERAEEQKR